jgi:hypothetical protein
MMFGFSGAETVARKRGYMAEAQAHWPFLTHFDASTIKNERQLVTTNKNEKINQAELDRYGIERVPADVFHWEGYRYSNAGDALAAAKRSAKS